MVKFSKELEAQLIPEWKDAFVNYWQLKKNVKKIKLKLSRKAEEIQEKHEYGFSVLDPILSIAKKISTRFPSSGVQTEIIQVRNKNRGGDEEDIYQTELVQLFSEEDEVKEFFSCLDEELNKVNQFYRTKESEFIERGELLNKQLRILLELKQILNDRRRKNLQSRLEGGTLPRSNSSSVRSSNHSEFYTESDETPPETPAPDEIIAALERNGVNFIGSPARTKTKKGKPKMSMRIDIPATTPTRAITAVTSMIWEDLVNNPKKEGVGDFFNRKKIQCAEKMIRGAFVELYRGLGLLKTYSSLNMVAFTKILKKFDKVANQQASGSYLRAVKRSHFISSDKVVRLADEVESIFTKHFANNDRKKAMKFLRPQQQKESHMITFFVGLFTGCFVTLFGVYAILAHLSGMFSATSEVGYIETVYPVFSMIALLSLHLFMYGCNLFMWKSTRINYNFIFEFNPSTALKYRDAFLICTSFMTTVVGAMVIHLLLRSNGFSPSQVDTIPGVLLLLYTGLLICPFNIFYRSTRYSFLRVMRNIIFSPFYKVLMVDFFMADQLTSQIPLLRHMESTACYIIAGSFKTHQYETCNSSKLYKELAYVISFSPYYWRAMQCARRWFDEGDVNHLANLGKYVSAMLAAGARLTFAMQPTQLWLVMVIITSSIATVYQLYWDFVKDWGLLNPKSKNPWLRDDLILKNKCIYYVSIAINLVLRLVWVETVMRFNLKTVESRLLDFFLASLEVIRRGHWNFYRLENEHLNNAGKFRAVKAVPLPFCEMDTDC
ncbi:PREDICTED: phosphate transporter PHO1-like [Nelumbo nucifera]|uniref:Phosphate transporter PHO1-like n=1 Tax=Nelumbo nucifera TaxID=4432 RepID=A0A1U8AQL9_NELNU|nr:PREDICTED: phosphate transporter PHO1-like [Nelumbo nucifera]